MTPLQINLVRDSFEKIAPISDQVAALFYARLFELEPSLRLLFRGELMDQGRKLMSTLAITVGMLNRIDLLLPYVRQLGAKHAAYGIRDHHYATVGVALLWTFEKGLGPEFTAEVREAWRTTFSIIAHGMMEGARSVSSPTPTPGPNLVAAG